jgi:hypothetical protein
VTKGKGIARADRTRTQVQRKPQTPSDRGQSAASRIPARDHTRRDDLIEKLKNRKSDR